MLVLQLAKYLRVTEWYIEVALYFTYNDASSTILPIVIVNKNSEEI